MPIALDDGDVARAADARVHDRNVYRAHREVPERARQPEARLGGPVRENIVRKVHDAHAGVPDQYLALHDADERVLEAEVRGQRHDAAGHEPGGRCAQLAACCSPASRGLPQGKLPRSNPSRDRMPYLYLVRHAQPDFAGYYDSVTALGVEQSAWLGEHFAALGQRFERVISGSLDRQRARCDAILERLPTQPGADH